MTGANGFGGSGKCVRLHESDVKYRTVARLSPPEGTHSDFVLIEIIDGQIDWKDALRELRTTVHLAARVHEIKKRAAVAVR